MPLSFSASCIQFQDGTAAEIPSNAIVLFVGPNNSGKSTALREINKFLIKWQHSEGQVIRAVTSESIRGQDVTTWMNENYPARKRGNGDIDWFVGKHSVFEQALLSAVRENKGISNRDGNPFVRCSHGGVQQDVLKQDDQFDTATEAPRTPLQRMFVDAEFEEKVAASFRRAFGQNLFINRSGGKRIPLHVGEMPALEEGERYYSLKYIEKFQQIPRLTTQGHGMKSFVGAILAVSEVAPVIIIDEPDLYLHPPQAHELGRYIAAETKQNKQLFLATHSPSFLRGLLEGDTVNDRLCIVRLERDENLGKASFLPNVELTKLKDTPLLRYSNALDGLFYKHVVVCEGDADCRFFAAITSALAKSQGIPDPNVLFVPTGGKDQLAQVAKPLSDLSIRVSVVADIDLLSNVATVAKIARALGVDWDSLEGACQAVRQYFEDIDSPTRTSSQVSEDIRKILDGIIHLDHFPSDSKKAIRAAMKTSSVSIWDLAKRVGTKMLRGKCGR